MSFGFVEVTYRLDSEDKSETHIAKGVQIGRFAVRLAEPDSIESSRMPSVEVSPFRVDHIPSGRLVAAFDNFEEAYALADDLSRFSKSDPASKDIKRIRAQFGEQVVLWLQHIHGPVFRGEAEKMVYIPYREWLAGQGKEWKPSRRKMKSLFR